MTSLAVMEHILCALLDPLAQALEQMKEFPQHLWFWRAVMQASLLRYLHFAHDETLVKTAQSLLYAYKYPGTMEGIIQLSYGLFGQQSLVIVEDDQHPAVLSISIRNANTRFLFGLAKDGHYALSYDRQFAMALSDLSEAVSYDPRHFFTQFLTPGRVLSTINISTEVTHHAD